MKISDLQEKLEEIKAGAGDLNVAIVDSKCMYFEFDPVIDILEIPTEDYKKLYIPICAIGKDDDEKV